MPIPEFVEDHIVPTIAAIQKSRDVNPVESHLSNAISGVSGFESWKKNASSEVTMFK
jgi:hypothetical protein